MSKSIQKDITPKLRFPEFSKTEIWSEKRLSDLFQIGSGKDYKHLSEGDIPVYGSGGYMLSVNDFLYDGESVCIGRKGTIDNPIFLTGKFWTVDTLFYTHSFNNCLPKFIFYLFQGIDWRKHNEAGGVPSLSKEIINKIKTFVPLSISEQQKITDCLSTLDDLVAAQNDKVEKLKIYKNGLLQQLFPREGEVLPRLRFSEFKINGAWKEESLGSLASIIKLKNKDFAEERVLTNSAAQGVLDQRDFFEKDIAQKGKLNGYYIVNKGDFVYNPRVSNLAPVGPISRNDIGKGVMSPLYTIFRFNVSETDFFVQFFKSSNWHSYLKSTANQGARHDRMAVTNAVLLDMPILIPSKEEQQRIASFLTSFDDLIILEKEKLNYLSKHKKGLLQQLFPSSLNKKGGK